MPDTAEDAALLQALNEAIDDISPDLKVTGIVDFDKEARVRRVNLLEILAEENETSAAAVLVNALSVVVSILLVIRLGVIAREIFVRSGVTDTDGASPPASPARRSPRSRTSTRNGPLLF